VTVSVDAGGRVTGAMSEPGTPKPLAAAGVCILRKLIFVPARRNRVNIESTLSWPILVRPPG